MIEQRKRALVSVIVVAVLGWTGASLAEPTSETGPPPATAPALPSLADLPLASAPAPTAGPGQQFVWQRFMAYRESLRWAGGLALAHLAFHGIHRARRSGRLVTRFRLPEVLIHALVALSFVAAWASATYLMLAKPLLGVAEPPTPVPGGRLASLVHVLAGLAFLAGIVALGALWRRSMRLVSHDAAWLRAAGGLLSRTHRHLPEGRFNAGQKIWYRVSLAVGALVAASGALIYYPGMLPVSQTVAMYVGHTALAVTLSVAVVLHVYLAMIVNPDRARAIVTGKVDAAAVPDEASLEPASIR